MLIPPVSTATIVFDMTDFGLQNMDYVPVKFMIKCFEANYPESLGLVLVHRAPWVFQGIWRVIRGWLDPVVASKINFTNSVTDLAAFLPENETLKELGGKKDQGFEFTQPVAGEDDKLKDEQTRTTLENKRKELISEYEDVIRDWMSSDQLDASPEREVKIRARSIYDRTGEIRPPKSVMAPTINAAGAGLKESLLSVPVISSVSISGRTSTSSNDVFEDAQEHTD